MVCWEASVVLRNVAFRVASCLRKKRRRYGMTEAAFFVAQLEHQRQEFDIRDLNSFQVEIRRDAREFVFPLSTFARTENSETRRARALSRSET